MTRSRESLTVACVWVRGHYPYTADFVFRLRGMVSRNLSLPHKFVCLTDRPDALRGIEAVRIIPPRHSKGWWAKVLLFGPALQDVERVLYLDLDTLITGSLDDIATFPAPIAFTPPHHVLLGIPEPRTLGGRVNYRYQSSCFVFTPPAGRAIFDRFTPDVMARLASDQDWIAEVDPTFPTMPREWFAKLRQCPQGPRDGVKVVIGDGKWKNDTAPWQWVANVWKQGEHGNLLSPQSSLAHTGH